MLLFLWSNFLGEKLEKREGGGSEDDKDADADGMDDVGAEEESKKPKAKAAVRFKDGLPAGVRALFQAASDDLEQAVAERKLRDQEVCALR